ncbi:uncharacterized protein N7483_004843 [Penicillium malachiteum]|uniref:uncharacterized protein n=1 Tax=Penicillium malachiteum TaxID=1324776 RepID=UPI00254768C7|nr:uncharacterized protein N7483_004843 [Penicillium malachiteum]KAJ5730335.1 hypothetical protein N7483_004843 [Penicillium malachiteum]
MGETSTSVEIILKSINDINSDSFETDGDRVNALLAAYALVSRLETPWETVARIVLNEPLLAASLKILVDLQLFERWQEKGDMVESCDNLAGMVNCDPSFLGRILRHLAANNLLKEISTNLYKPTKLTNTLLLSKHGEWINWMFDNGLPAVAKMPEFLQKTDYKSPTDPEDGIFQYAKEYKGDLFKYFADNPRDGECFNHCMGGVMAQQVNWLKLIPVEEFLSGADPELPLVVDIGGSLGHDLDKFRLAYPDTASKLYLQDLPEVIERSTCPNPVNKMAHDFFQPQPVKSTYPFNLKILFLSIDGSLIQLRDARIYYIHAVLHDWPNEHARKILEMLHDALKPGYSHLLIHDYVVPDQGAHRKMTSYDLSLMAAVAGKERTKSEFCDLLYSAGYRLVRVWRSSPASQAIIQAELA